MSEPVEEPIWLVPKIDQRLALMEEALGPIADLEDQTVVMTPLTEPPEGSTQAEFERWDRSCDNCGTFCPEPNEFYTGHSIRYRGDIRVVFSFGACPACRWLS